MTINKIINSRWLHEESQTHAHRSAEKRFRVGWVRFPCKAKPQSPSHPNSAGSSILSRPTTCKQVSTEDGGKFASKHLAHVPKKKCRKPKTENHVAPKPGATAEFYQFKWNDAVYNMPIKASVGCWRGERKCSGQVHRERYVSYPQGDPGRTCKVLQQPWNGF